jgi:excisionase family DNA binding protein
MRRKAITTTTTTRELVQRMDNARGPVDAPRSDAERAVVERRIAWQFPVERQSVQDKLDAIARTNTPQEFNLIMFAAEQLRQTARENPQRFGMSVAEAAAALGVSLRHVERLIESGELRGEKLAGVGQRLFIDADDVARMRAEREAAGKLKKKGTDSQ